MVERSLEKIHQEALQSLAVVGFVDRDGQTVIRINGNNPLLEFLIFCHLVCVCQIG